VKETEAEEDTHQPSEVCHLFSLCFQVQAKPQNISCFEPSMDLFYIKYMKLAKALYIHKICVEKVVIITWLIYIYIL